MPGALDLNRFPTQPLFTISCDALPADTRVLRLGGTEGISHLYSFTLQLLMHEDEGLVFEMEQALNAPATLTIHGGDGTPRRTLHGVLASIDWVRETADHTVYEVVLVPRLWRLGLNQHSNVYVQQAIPTIITNLLEDNGFVAEDYALRLKERYPKLEHVSQYRESDLAFIQRRMEREGIYFYFEQLEDREKLIITDHKSYAASSGSVRYFPQAGRNLTGVEAFATFTSRCRTRPKEVRLREYDYLRPTMDLKKSHPVSPHGVGEVVSHDEHYTTPADGKRLAQARAEELKAREAIFEGRGRAFEAQPGYLFEVCEHPRPSFNASYLAVTVEHEGSQGIGDVEELDDEAPTQLNRDAEPTYFMRVEAIPSGVQFRPPQLTPVPRIFGVETGRVDGEQESQYAQIDEHGRYRLQLHFDENDPRNGKASTWVRMLQPHGGSREGFHFPLRKGTEVLLVFLGGDPDRPVIAGVVPNPHTPSPVTQNNATFNVLLTGGGNRMELEDKADVQHVRLSTPTQDTLLHMGAPDESSHNIHLRSNGSALIDLGGDYDTKVQGAKTEYVKKSVTETYDNLLDTKVKEDRFLTVSGNDDTKVTKEQKLKVTGNRTVTAESNQTHTVTGKDTHTITGQQKITANGGQNITVGSSGRTETISGPLTQTTGPQTLTVNGVLTQTITGAATITSPVSYNIVAPNVNQVAPAKNFKSAPWSGEAIGFKFSILGAKAEVVAGMAVAATNVKMDLTSLKMDIATMKYQNNPTTIKTFGAAIQQAYCNLHVVGLFVVA
ncbi:type VI secretion system Vgr family protein [Hyalangium rubrum]|uniref:Type VI secretion system tip protein TssI/VgrG n=1 Tax=Hyalangium rubrum TaxID=3103134 RepID=A0ABU5H2Q3_9BACT|nr:type VI secretion system tip protein TssI/VgrG [Hyalangium sp. s54d21]MDY7227174.1 type VI secretion system tip protein TssI/VgrG [Hyalangium sp. s54d21]